MDLVLSESKQKLLIEYMLSSPDIFAIVNNIISHKYFVPQYRQPIKFIKKYYENHKNLPSMDIIESETDVLFEYKENITKDKTEYVINEIERFVKLENFRLQLLKAADQLLENKPLETIKDNFIKNTEIGINRSLGVSVFDDAEELLNDLVTDTPISTGYKTLDDAIGGGLYKQTLTIFAAFAGFGKSNTTLNIVVNCARQGLNILYITLELNTKMVFSRMNAQLTNINPNNLSKHVDETVIRLRSMKKDYGDIILEYFPAGSSVNDFKPFIKDIEHSRGCTFDLIAVDYLGEMSPNDKTIPAYDISTRDRAIASELRSLGVELNVPIISAAQIGKNANDKELSQTSMAGGKALSNITDNLIYIICNDDMLQAGMMDFQIIKNRVSNGRGLTLHYLWNSNSMRIYEPNNPDDLAKIEKRKAMNNKEIKQSKESERSKLMNKFNDFK